MNTAVPIIRGPGEGDKQSFLGGGLHTWKLMTEDTAGAFFLFEDFIAQGKTTPLHRHPEADETVYVLEGEIVVKIDGKESRVGAGGMTFTPKGVPHAFLVVSDGARLLAWQTPRRFSKKFSWASNRRGRCPVCSGCPCLRQWLYVPAEQATAANFSPRFASDPTTIQADVMWMNLVIAEPRR